MKPKRGERQRDPERVTRSLFAGGGNGQADRQPLDPFQQLLRLLGDAKRDALAVVQLQDSSSSDGTRKLVESCAKLAQGSARTAEMVKLEEPQDEYGYPPADSANRLNPQQSAKAVATLLDACHMGMRAVLETANAQEQQGRSTDAGSEQPAPQQSAGKAGEDSAPAAASPATSPATSQLWRCAINVATALQDASRLLAAPATYLAYTSADPSCDALLSLGELAATVMRRASLAAAATTLAARRQMEARGGEDAAVLVPGGLLIDVPAGAAPPTKAEGEGAAAGEAGSARVKAESEAPAAGGTGKGGDVEMEEAIGGAGVKPEAEAGAEAKQEQPLAADGAAAAGGWVAPSQPPDVCCLLASHGYSLLLVACEQQPESLLDSVLQQPGGAQRMQHVTSAALELAAVRITETAYCDTAQSSGQAAGGSGSSGNRTSGDGGGAHANGIGRSSKGPGTSTTTNRATATPGGAVSFQVRQLQLVALRFAELLTDDGNTQLEAKRALLPALCEALLAEPRRCVDWWGCGRPAVLSSLQQPQLAQAAPLGGGPPAAPAPSAPAPAVPVPPEADAGAGAEASAEAGAGSASGPGTGASMLPPACPSNHEAKLTTCAVGMLLKNPASRATCMPLLLGCVRLPGPGGAAASQGLPPPPSAPGAAAPQQLQCPGQFPPGYLGGYLPQQQGLLPPGQQPGQPQPQPNWSAFGDNFRTERFMAVGTGDEREELYVGGRGRGYKKTRVLNPEAHGVDCDAVGLVTTAMATSLEYAVLMCKLLANASVGAPPVPLDEAADAGANSDPAAAGATEPGAQREQPAPQQEPKPEDGAGGVEVKAEPGGEEAKAGAAAGAKPGRQDLHLLPLASAFRRMLEDRYLKGQQAQQDQKVAGASSAEGSSEGEAALAALDAQALLPPGELALYAAIERVAVNLAAVLSLLQPVCPNGGQDIRASLAVLHLPTLRWPRMSVRLPQLLGVEDVELLLGVAEDLCTTTGAFSKRLQELRRQRHAERRRIRERYQLPKKQPKGHRRGEDGTSMPQLTRLLRRGAACPVGQSDSEDEAAAEQARAASGLNGLAARAPGGQPGGAHLKQTHVQHQQQRYMQQHHMQQQQLQGSRPGLSGPAGALPYGGMAGVPMAPSGPAAAVHMQQQQYQLQQQQQQQQLKRPRVSEEGAAGMAGPRGFDPAAGRRTSGSGQASGHQQVQPQQQQPAPRLSNGGGGGGILMASMASMAAAAAATGGGSGGGGGGGPTSLPRFPAAGGPAGLPSHPSGGGPMGGGPASLPSFGGGPPQGAHAGPQGSIGRTTVDDDEWIRPGPRGAAPVAPRATGPASLPRFDAPGAGGQPGQGGGGMPFHQQQQHPQQQQHQQHAHGGYPPQFAAHPGGHPPQQSGGHQQHQQQQQQQQPPQAHPQQQQQHQQQYPAGLQAALAGGPASLPMFQPGGPQQPQHQQQLQQHQQQQQQQQQYRPGPPPTQQQYYGGGGGM